MTGLSGNSWQYLAAAVLWIALAVIAMISFRMLFPNPAWRILPKSWQMWLRGRDYSPFRHKHS